MTVNVPDRFKAANAFWLGLAKIGLTPAAVLGQARMPVTVYDGKKNLVTTAQFFALWRAVGELSSDAAAGLKIATRLQAPRTTLVGRGSKAIVPDQSANPRIPHCQPPPRAL